ncbi:hypothetical protein AAF712_003031 [Marasmius tenuissimus]|uniref:CRAL/TRIO N-terminal domain-containing protein n=1 Tax=Marasmius tenuissimus TaxID=585030 RepID=A0ABR3AB29_9AGAR
MSQLSQEEKLAIFRKELFDEGILKEGDSIGTDDETLKRFLRARKYDLVQAKKMFRDAQHWRQTVEGVGIDELYKQIDPFDYPERKDVFECWPMWFHKVRLIVMNALSQRPLIPILGRSDRQGVAYKYRKEAQSHAKAPSLPLILYSEAGP